jgi:general secretion pathway protein K
MSQRVAHPARMRYTSGAHPARMRYTSGAQPARMRHPSGAHRQRGVALIIALVLVALAAILATKLTYDSWLERRRTTSIIAVEQAFHFGLGGEALAADVLTRLQQTSALPGQTQPGQSVSTQNASQPASGQPNSGQGNQVTLAQPWAQPTQTLPITPDNDPEGAPIGSFQGALEDMQGRFNLNSLGHMIASAQANSGLAASTPGGAIQDPVPLQIFQRLLVSVGLEPKWAGIARDWLDQDAQPGEPDGAEDAVYTQQSPPYLTGNWPMMSASELMNMPGFGADRYRKIAPYVTALPTATAKINICTAPAPVLQSFAQDVGSDYTPELLANERKSGCFPDKQTFANVLGPKVAASVANWYTDTSMYFRLTTRVTLGTTEFTLYSLLFRGSAKATPLLRSFGTP